MACVTKSFKSAKFVHSMLTYPIKIKKKKRQINKGAYLFPTNLFVTQNLIIKISIELNMPFD